MFASVVLGVFLLGQLAQGDVIDAVLPAIARDLGDQVSVLPFTYYWQERLIVSREYGLSCTQGSLRPPSSLRKQSATINGNTANSFVSFQGIQYNFNSCYLKTGSSNPQEPITGQLGDHKVALNVELASAGSGCRVTVKQFFFWPLSKFTISENDIIKKIRSHKQYGHVSERLKDHVRYSFDQALLRIVGKQYTVPVKC